MKEKLDILIFRVNMLSESGNDDVNRVVRLIADIVKDLAAEIEELKNKDE